MNWEAIGAAGEIMGALGVIVSLGYLGFQIRHSAEQTRINTKSVQATAYQQLIDHHTNLNMKLATQPELFEIMLRAEFEGMETLDILERSRWEVFIASSLRSYLNGFYLRNEGLITDEQWRNLTFGLGTMARRPAFAGWWRQEKQRREFPDGFVAMVDAASEPGATDGDAASDMNPEPATSMS